MQTASLPKRGSLELYDYPLTCALFSVGVMYSLFWVGIDAMVSLGLWPAGTEFDAGAFVESLSIVNHIAFYGLNVANLAAAIALVRRSRWALPLFATSLALGLIDWIFLSFNPHFDGHIQGHIIFSLEAYVVWRLYRHTVQGRLR